MDVRERMKLIGERVRAARREAGLSQTELGKRVGYSLNGIAKIERGETDPKFSSLVKIADALNLSIVDLVLEEPELLPRGGLGIRGLRPEFPSNSLLAQVLAAGIKKVIEEAPDSKAVLKSWR